jgi:UDP-N-acetyl-D-glucosamine dehydrogenase
MKKTRHYQLEVKSVELTPELLQSQDAAVILTDHDAYDWEFIARHVSLLIDTRNATKGVVERSHIAKL